MTHAALSPLIGPEFDEFLGAPIGEDRNGTTLSVLSALARLDVDPWEEATILARMPRQSAAERLTALIDALPRDPASAIPLQTSAADLVALLPKGKTPDVPASDHAFSASGLRRQQIVLAFCAFAMMMLAVFAISANFSPGRGTRANPSGPRAADATLAPPRKLDP
jgi:hypothetical protein